MNMINENELWQEYLKSKDVKIRNKIAGYYYKLVQYLVNKITNDKNVKNDLINVGIISLLESIEKYKPELKVKFITFAYYKIYGSIIDYLRSIKINKNLNNDNLKKLKNAMLSLKNKGIDYPTEQQIAEALNMTLDEFNNFLNNTYQSKIDSLESLVDNNNIENKLLLKNVIADIIEKKLTYIEKMVITLYYYENFTFKEIGEILDLTEARVSQIHLLAIYKIKTNILFDKILL